MFHLSTKSSALPCAGFCSGNSCLPEFQSRAGRGALTAHHVPVGHPAEGTVSQSQTDHPRSHHTRLPSQAGGIQNHQPDREGPTACCSTELRPRFTAGCSVTAPVPPMGTGSVRWDLGSVQCRVCLRSPVCFQDWIQETQKQRCQHES